MDRGLVTIGVTATSKQLLDEAAEHAAGADADLVLLSILTEEEYEHNLEVLDRIAHSEHSTVGQKGAIELAEDLGNQMAREALSEFDLEYEVVGMFVRERIGRRIIKEAINQGCDHVFVLGKQRGGFRALFENDPVKEVLDKFDGFVTTGRETDPDRRFVRYRDESLEVITDF